jgi:TetR/AcrR family transcriptional repressor of nem operon
MPRNGSATRDRILDTAERLVIENGYAATSLDSVIAESATSKGAFFHHFASKLDLARSLVDRYVAADIANLNAALADVQAETDEPAEQVVALLQIFEDAADDIMAAQSSCLYVSVLSERRLARSGPADQITTAVLAWRAGLSALLRQALGEGSSVDAEALADHVFVTFEGAFVLSRSMDDRRYMRAQLTVLRQLVESLLAGHG